MKLLFGRVVSALAGLLAAIGLFLGARGGLRARLAAVGATAAGQRAGFAVLRLFKPRLALARNPIVCYPAEGALLLTRAADFRDAIARQAEFEVVYGPRMRALTGGRDFFLGMQDGPDYRRDTASMRAIVRRDDLDPVVAMARAMAAAALAGGEVDLPPALATRVPAEMVRAYFGIAMDPDILIADTTILFHYLFSDLDADPTATTRAMAAKDRVNAAIDAGAANADPRTLLGRAVAAGKSGDPSFDAAGIRANMIGIAIGAIPTLNKAACLAVDELCRRPEALSRARAAAAAGDEAALAGFLWEALRFNPVSPLLYRRARADTSVGGTPVKAGTMVLAANLSATFDEAALPDPRAFRVPRPWTDYVPWGEGLHRCWGDHINRAVLPAMLTPLLAKPGLRVLSPIETGGIPYPIHFRLGWD
jgi:cytochrome P450